MFTSWIHKGSAVILKPSQRKVDVSDVRAYLSSLKSEPLQYVHLIFDFQEVEEITDAAIRTLTLANHLATQSDARLAIISSRPLKSSIDRLGLGKLLPCFDSIDAVTGSISSTEEKRRDLQDAIQHAVQVTLQTIAATEVKVLPPETSGRDGRSKTLELGAVVGLTSEYFRGSLVLGLPATTFLNIMSRMFNTPYTEINDDIKDGPAELLNIILGNIRSHLSEKGFALALAIPSTVRGMNISIASTVGADGSVTLPFRTDCGDFFVELTSTFTAARAAA